MRQRIHQRTSPSSLQEAEGTPPGPVGGRACAQDFSPASGALGTPYFHPLCPLLWGASAEGLKLGPAPHPEVTGPGFKLAPDHVHHLQVASPLAPCVQPCVPSSCPPCRDPDSLLPFLGPGGRVSLADAGIGRQAVETSNRGS